MKAHRGILLRALLGAATFGRVTCAIAGTANSAADLAFLRDLTRDVVAASRVMPGQKVGGSPTNSCGFTLIMPGGRGGYPAFWIRDFAMSLESGFISADEMLNHLRLVARCQNGPSARPLKHGLVVPPFAIPDHINFDGSAVFYPGTYASGDDQGTGAYGILPPVDDHYEFVQNGAYWPTPTGWLIEAVRRRESPLASQVFADYVQHLRRHDYRQGPAQGAPWECFGPKGYAQNGVYMTSVTLPWSVLSDQAPGGRTTAPLRGDR